MTAAPERRYAKSGGLNIAYLRGGRPKLFVVSEDHDPAPVRVIEASGKLRNGLFLREVRVYGDRVAFEVFASRPIQMTELADLSLRDDAGTQYTMVCPDPPVLDGRARVEFQPAVPEGALFSLSQPGWALSTYGGAEER